MTKKITLLLAPLLLSGFALNSYAQVKAISKTPATNAITEDLVFPAARTLTLSGTLSGTPTGGTFSLANLTLTLPSDVTRLGSTIDLSGAEVTGSLPWASVSKTSSSLADLITRSAGDLTSGTLDNSRLDPTLTALGNLTLAANQIIYATGADAVATIPSTIYGRGLLNTADLDAVVADASTTVKGKIELATNAETITGTDTVRGVVPSALEAWWANIIGTDRTITRAWTFDSVTASGNVNATDVNASGSVTATTVNANGDVNASGNVNATGDVTANGNVTATGDVTANGNVTATGDVTATTVTANGINLTALNATELTSGTVPAARMAQRTTFSNAAATISAGTAYLGQTGNMSASRVVTLPLASSVPGGYQLVIADESGTVTSANTIVITRAGADTINNQTTETMTTAYAHRRLISNGSNAWVLL